MTNHGSFRHMNLDLMRLTDDEIDKLLTNNSEAIEDEYIKAEAWDVLAKTLEQTKGQVGRNEILVEMERIYEKVAGGY